MRSGATHTRALWARGRVDYAVGEKLLNFASAPATIRHSPGSFLGSSPKCADCFRPMKFAPILRLERGQAERDAETRENRDEDEFPDERPAETAERVRQFVTIKELLTADTLGTS